MRKLARFALLGAVALGAAGAAAAATPAVHVLEVALPDGGVAHIRYRGDVPPSVVIAPAPLAFAPMAPMAMPGFAGFDRMFAELDRQAAAIARQARQMALAADRPGAGVSMAGYGNVPAGARSVSVVTVSTNGHSCTRTTAVTGQGAGKPAKVVTRQSGECSAAAGAPVRPKVPVKRRSSPPINQT